MTIAAGAAPDVFTLGDGWEVQFAPALMPLDSIVSKWSELKDYVPSTLEASKYKGVLYGLPYRANPWITAYNAGYFREAGLNPDVAPDNCDDVSKMAKKLVKTDAAGKIIRAGAIHYGAAASHSYHAYTVRALMGQNGVDWASLFDVSTLESTAKSNATREAFDYYTSFMRNNSSAWTGNWTQFAAGNTAIMIAAQVSDINGYRTANPLNAEDARAGLPIMKVKRAAPMPVDKIGIYKESKNPELAAKFLLFLNTRENLGKYLASLNTVPARRSMGTLDYIRKDHEVQVYLESLQYGMPSPRSIFVDKVATALGKAASDNLYKNTPFEEAIEGMITTIKALGI
jgi:ABC-type glycerol-3-phosphate transport system substrate-binding protein